MAVALGGCRSWALAPQDTFPWRQFRLACCRLGWCVCAVSCARVWLRLLTAASVRVLQLVGCGTCGWRYGCRLLGFLMLALGLGSGLEAVGCGGLLLCAAAQLTILLCSSGAGLRRLPGALECVASVAAAGTWRGGAFAIG